MSPTEAMDCRDVAPAGVFRLSRRALQSRRSAIDLLGGAPFLGLMYVALAIVLTTDFGSLLRLYYVLALSALALIGHYWFARTESGQLHKQSEDWLKRRQ